MQLVKDLIRFQDHKNMYIKTERRSEAEADIEEQKKNKNKNGRKEVWMKERKKKK